ncbi:LacI family DNA-binding transcriptional regulator [Ciceribacter thiooxidans]|uniref:LacI family DNA-binding transcriptional regulator n=1 Tax=Ciceribacter thiooxidans TaxID=1969821 RepID=UPI001FD2B82A|nr:LacI family DNA-binding transcriptional regulator [Ciceribacter thiooxidans]
MRKPILEDVAAAAGVSKMTASRALRGRATFPRIQSARSGRRPNGSAMSATGWRSPCPPGGPT